MDEVAADDETDTEDFGRVVLLDASLDTVLDSWLEMELIVIAPGLEVERNSEDETLEVFAEEVRNVVNPLRLELGEAAPETELEEAWLKTTDEKLLL